MGRFRDAMIEEMKLRGYSPRTIRCYVRNVAGYVRFHGRSPELISPSCVRWYITHICDNAGCSASCANQAISALKFFYREVLKIPCADLEFPRPRGERRLPDVLSEDEVRRLLSAVRNRKHLAIVMLAYSAGLRVGEVVSLRKKDLDRERGLIRVRTGKGRKGRRTILSEAAVKALDDYIEAFRPGRWLFPGRTEGRHITPRSVQNVVRAAAARAGIEKRVTPHTLRHSFAAHLLESGTDLRYIQELLGHGSSRTTEIYTRVSRRDMARIVSPLDRLMGERPGGKR